MRRFLILVPLVALFVVGGVALFRVRPDVVVGSPAPDINLPILGREDEELSLEELRGRNVILNFWASWCDPCEEEAPHFAKIAAERADDSGSDVTFLGVNILDGRGAASDFVDRFGLGFDSVVDRGGTTKKTYGWSGAPETVFIDERGIVVGKFIGAIGEDELASLVEQLVTLNDGDLMRITGSGRTQPAG